jgi:hypothetical protein
MSAENGEDNGMVVCCFEQSAAVTGEIDCAIKTLRREVESAKLLIQDTAEELIAAFDAQLAAVELRRKALHLTMNPCPDLAQMNTVKADDWGDFLNALPARAGNALRSDKIESFAQLCAMPESEVLRIPNCGRISARHIKDELARRGRSFA